MERIQRNPTQHKPRAGPKDLAIQVVITYAAIGFVIELLEACPSRRRSFKAWSNNAMRSKLKPVKKVVKMLRRHEERMLNFSQHKITNACAEGFNSAIQLISQCTWV